jgi:hypothetical protein
MLPTQRVISVCHPNSRCPWWTQTREGGITGATQEPIPRTATAAASKRVPTAAMPRLLRQSQARSQSRVSLRWVRNATYSLTFHTEPTSSHALTPASHRRRRSQRKIQSKNTPTRSSFPSSRRHGQRSMWTVSVVRRARRSGLVNTGWACICWTMTKTATSTRTCSSLARFWTDARHRSRPPTKAGESEHQLL